MTRERFRTELGRCCRILLRVMERTASTKRDRLLSGPFVLVSLSNLFQGISFNLYLHFPGFLSELGAREAQIGLLFGLSSVASIAVRPKLGQVMDTRGRRGVILVGNALHVVSVALYLTVHTLGPWIYFVRILHGLAVAILFTALFTYAADCVPEKRRMQGLMLFGVSGMLPIALGGVIGDVLLGGGLAGDYYALGREVMADVLESRGVIPNASASDDDAVSDEAVIDLRSDVDEALAV